MLLSDLKNNIVVLDDIKKLEQPVNKVAGYEYIVAGNGIFVRGENEFFKAVIKIADCEIRNLKEIKESFEMKQGKIPLDIAFLIRNFILQDDTYTEKFLQVYYDFETKNYGILVPNQKRDSISVSYRTETNKKILLELHTHPNMSAFFSETDDNDEKGFRLYCVISVIDGKIEDFKARLGIYGYYKMLEIEDFCEVYE